MFSGFLDDLNEFVTTVKEDTTQVFSRAADIVKQSGDASAESEETFVPTQPKQVAFLKVVETPEVLLSPEASSGELFEEYCASFNLADHDLDISSILEESDELKTIYTDYVPQHLTHSEFWTRYFFLKSQDLLARHRVGEIEMQEEDLTWEDEDGEVEIPKEGGEESDVKPIVSDLELKLQQANEKILEYEQLNESLKAKLEAVVPVTVDPNEEIKKELAETKAELQKYIIENESLRVRIEELTLNHSSGANEIDDEKRNDEKEVMVEAPTSSWELESENLSDDWE